MKRQLNGVCCATESNKSYTMRNLVLSVFSQYEIDFLFPGLPVVNREWLLECYRRKIRIPFKNYLVGDSIQPVDDIDEPDMITEDEILQVEQPDEEEQEKQLDGLADTRKLPNQNVDRVLQEGIRSCHFFSY